MVPQMVGDDAFSFHCFTCYSDVRFHTCPTCGLAQTVVASWTSYTCGRCESRVDAPRRWSYGGSPRASKVEGYAFPYPKL